MISYMPSYLKRSVISDRVIQNYFTSSQYVPTGLKNRYKTNYKYTRAKMKQIIYA